MANRKLRRLIATGLLSLMLALAACGGGTTTTPDGTNMEPTVTAVP